MPEIDAANIQAPAPADEASVSSGEAPAEAGSEQVEPKTTSNEPVEDYEALKKDRDELKHRIGEMRDEVGRLRALVGQPMPYPQYPQYPVNPAPAEPQVEIPVSDDEWFGNPKAAAAKIYLKAKQDAAEEARRAAREEAMRMAASNQVVNQFYERFPELNNKRDKELVDAFAIKFQNDIVGLNPYQIQQLYPDPMKTIAERVKEYKTAIAEEARTKQNKTQPLHVGPGGGAAPVATQVPQKPQTEKERFDEFMAERRRMTNKS